MTVALLGSGCKCDSCQTDTPPVRVHRHTRSRIEIISSDSIQKVQDRYFRFKNFIDSYGAIIKSITHEQSEGTVDGVPYTTHSVFINYELPANVTDKILIGAYEK